MGDRTNDGEVGGLRTGGEGTGYEAFEVGTRAKYKYPQFEENILLYTYMDYKYESLEVCF